MDTVNILDPYLADPTSVGHTPGSLEPWQT
jgi:hypothetical protein